MSKLKLDLSYLDMVSGGDKGFVIQMLDLFLTSIPPEVTRLKQFYEKGDFTFLSKSAHRMKATIQMLGEQELVALVAQTEQIGKTGLNQDELPKLISEIENRVAALTTLVTETKSELGTQP